MSSLSPADNSYPLVSIILLNWNQLEVTSACLSSLQQITYSNIEVVVVDQNSSKNEYVQLKKRFPWVTHIKSESNLGFTGGNNLAILYCRGELILLLNNDTEVQNSFLEPIVAAFGRDNRLGIASPKIRFFDEPDKIQYAGCEGLNEWTMRGSTTGHGEIDTGNYDKERRTVLAHGAAMMIRRKTFADIGLLGKQFFVYYEEYDFCLRARRAGWEIRYIPSSVVFHKVSVSIGKNSPQKTYFMARNRITFLRRNVRGIKKVCAISFVLFVALPLALFRSVIRGRYHHISAHLRGVLWHLSARNIHENTYLPLSDSETLI